MPNLTRVFVPNFPVELTTTTLSVDDLIQHCYAAGYTKDGVQETGTHSSSGSLTMAVQPTNTAMEGVVSAEVASDGTEAYTSAPGMTIQSLSPTEVAFDNILRESVAQAPAGAVVLADAAITLDGLCSQWSHDAAFDPTSEVTVSFNPNDGDPWDSLNMTTLTNTDLDWDSILQDP